ncbi:hypothetical protein B7494_g5710 [Chlorociboria aeruginascens]|nr:hypothetical protein B7494_g5710 [Chlorociboria aeruginascens]
MKPISLAVTALLGASNFASAQTEVLEGCYSSSTGLTFQGEWKYQSSGYCQSQCLASNSATFAMTAAKDCWCGNEFPPVDTKAANSSCNAPCVGYDQEMCGGIGFYSVYLSGLTTSADNAADSANDTDSSISSSASTLATPSPTSPTSASVVTVGGQTVSVTTTGVASSSATAKASGGASKAGIAAGVVVGIVGAAAVSGGIFMFLRNRKKKQIEEEYRRNAAVNSFVNGGKPPTSSSGGGSFTDTRLDPTAMAQRRMSDGSIADNQDYSRRILKVTNA